MSIIAIDRFGRVVIPKGMRDRLAWTEGTELDVSVASDGVHLTAVQAPAVGQGLVVREQGLVYDAVWEGQPDADLTAALAEARGEQADRQAAWPR